MKTFIFVAHTPVINGTATHFVSTVQASNKESAIQSFFAEFGRFSVFSRIIDAGVRIDTLPKFIKI